MNTSFNWQELGSSRLFSEHKQYLKERAVSEEVAKINNLRSLRPEETAAVWPGRKCELLLVPYSKYYGSGRTFGSEAKFLTTADKPSRILLPKLPRAFRGLTNEAIFSDPTNDLSLIEGPFKTLSAISNGILAVGISGCWNWQKNRQPLPSLKKYNWKDRNATPIFDADITGNNNVLLPYLLLGDWLESLGAHVKFLKIPSIKGGKTGVDDYIAIRGKDKFESLRRESWANSVALEALRISAMRTTEGGLSSLFALHYADDVRYDNDEETWYAWNGTLWARQPKTAPDIQERVKNTVGWIINEAQKVKNEKRRASMRKWGANCDKRNVIRSAMGLASSDSRLRVSISQLDQDQWLLGTKSGIVDLRTGNLVNVSRDNMVTRSVAVEFDPSARCPRWQRFISEIMLGDKAMIAFLRSLVGYLLMGGNPLRYIFFLYGVGRNGKSVFIETLLKLMGDYGEPAKSELIMKHRADRDSESAQPFLFKLRGKRYITASEVGEGMQLDAAVVKTLTGGDQMTVRTLHAAPVKYTVEGKFVIRCNHRPIIDGGDQAIWDRVVAIPFDLRLEEDQQDTTLHTVLQDELPGLLNWAIRGCIEYQKSGLVKPKKVLDQTKDYRDSQDSFMQWHDERTRFSAKAKASSSALYGDYEDWCGRRSMRLPTFPIALKSFGDKLKDKGYQHTKYVGLAHWKGIQLRTAL